MLKRGEHDSVPPPPPPAIVTPPRVSGTRGRRKAERGARSSLSVCVGSFSFRLSKY